MSDLTSIQQDLHPAPIRRPRPARIIADNFEELVALAFLCIIGLVMVLQVLLRTVFSAPLSWPEELSQFLFVWCSALGAVGACKRYGLVSLGVVTEKLPACVRTILEYIVLVLIAVLLGILCWKGWHLTVGTSFSAATLPITWAWAYAAAPVVSVMMVARLVQMQVFRYRFEFVETIITAGHHIAKQEGVVQ